MNTSMRSKKRNLFVLATITILIVSIGVSTSDIVLIQWVRAQSKTNVTNSTIEINKPNMTIGGYGPNITGSLSLRNMISKTIESQVNVSLVNATTIAEKTVGANAHAISARIGAVYGFVVYIALVVDSNHILHSVLVDAGNGKVLNSAPISMASMMRNGIMTGPGTGMMFWK
jgi:hypothetical protein